MSRPRRSSANHSRSYLFVKNFKLIKKTSICKGVSFSVPGREEGVQISINTYQWRRLQIQSAETPYPCLLWHIDGEIVDTVADFLFWGSKITADGDCSHEIKRCLLLERKVMSNLDSILKSRDMKSTHRNHLHSYTLIMRKQKEKLRKQYIES